jgi:hypothetical protein
MNHVFVRFVLVELEACLSVTAVVVSVLIVAGWIATGTIHMPLEWLQSTSFRDYLLPAFLLAIFSVADSLWRAEFRRHHAHIGLVSHA